MYGTRTGILRMADKFRSEKSINIKYCTDGDYSELSEAYPINEIAGEGDDFSRSVRLLSWLSGNVKHKGDYDNHVARHARPLLDYAFGNDENGINCAALSEALTECLLSVGIKARALYMMPCSPYDFDNHVVTEAYSRELGKWFMLDPTFNLYVTEAGVPQSVMEIRSLLAGRKKLTFNAEADYNGNDIDYDDTVSYYAKDMYWFKINSVQGISNEAGEELVIAPVGFDAKAFSLANIDFRADSYGEEDWLVRWREYEKRAEYTYVGADVLRR